MNAISKFPLFWVVRKTIIITHILRFLEKKGLTKTVKDMRDELRAIDLDSNNRVAFIEFLMFTYKKTCVDLFSAKPSSGLLEKLEKAIMQYKAVFEERKKLVDISLLFSFSHLRSFLPLLTLTLRRLRIWPRWKCAPPLVMSRPRPS